MIRLELKTALINETMQIFQTIKARRDCLPKSFQRIVNRTILRDFKIGLRAINKKAKVFIELPEIKAEGNGMYSKVYEDEEESTSKEIIVVDENALIDSSKNNQESP